MVSRAKYFYFEVQAQEVQNHEGNSGNLFKYIQEKLSLVVTHSEVKISWKFPMDPQSPTQTIYYLQILLWAICHRESIGLKLISWGCPIE